MLDAQSGDRSSGAMAAGTERGGNSSPAYGEHAGMTTKRHIVASNGGASRFFYTAKASRSEREAGLEHRARQRVSDGRSVVNDTAYQRDGTERVNTHPTVKPLDLMRWLTRLICPPGGTVLDPFNGSGSTGCAAVIEGFDYIGIELDAKHCETSEARIAAALEAAGKLTPEDIPEDRTDPVQLGLLVDDIEGAPV